MFSFSSVSNCYTDKPAGCFHFPLKSIKHEEIKSAELWVYKLPDTGYSNIQNQTLVITRLGNPNRSQGYHSQELVDLRIMNSKQGWQNFDVKSLVKRWLHHPHHNYGLEVSCKDCAMDEDSVPVATKADLKPFLVIHIRDVRHRRTKRSAVDCHANTRECCRESFHVKFDDIGWGDWIIQPKKYTANFCRGSCLGKFLL